jgi:hypothetical protein
LLVHAPRAEADGEARDSARVRVEIGASTDLTNELFYEDQFTDADSIFHPRHLVDSPESQVAGVLHAALAGAQGRGAVGYQIHNELSLGDKVQRDVLDLSWRHAVSPDWRFTVLPRAEYRHDRTFDRDLEEWRGSLGALLRRSLADGSTFGEFGCRGEFLSSSGRGSHFLLDRRVGQASLSVDHVPLFGSEWRLAYRFAARSFPDSSERNHWAHGWEGRWRRMLGNGHGLTVETEGERRQTVDPALTSRDNFWQGDGAVEGEIRWGEARTLVGRVTVEAVHYDREDSLLFFDYQIARGRLGPRFELGSLSASLGPRAEALFSRHNPSEEYREIGGSTELEYLAPGTWWSLTPSAGWRDYTDSTDGDTLGVPGLHSSFAFYELSLLAEQALPGAVRLRLFATARYESHIDSAQDARSLYFSLDVRRLF